MKAFAKRLLYIIPSMFLVLLITFVLARIVPGDPARMLAGEQASEQALQQIREQMGLDKSIPAQFIDYLGQVLQGNFGTAWHTGKTVQEDFATRLPASIELALVSMLFSIIVGVPLGMLAAAKKDRWPDHVSRIISLLGTSLPVFWIGLMAIFVLYAKLDLIPSPMGRISPGINPPTHITGLYVLDSLLSADWVALKDSLQHLLLPALCMSFGTLAIISRITRTSMIETLNQDYIRTLRAKGISRRRIMLHHVLPNILIPVLTVIGTQFGVMIGNAVITETIFSWPGIGSYVTESILITDYAPVQAFAVLSVVLYIGINLLLDLSYVWIDPRLRKN